MKPSFKNEYTKAPKWQQKRYNKLIRSLEDIDLSEDEHCTLLWLCGLDQPSINNILSIIKKSQVV